MLRHRTRHALLAVSLLLATIASVHAGPPAGTPRIVVLLPGQTLVPGTGVTGTPDTIPQRSEFTVHLYAVDASFDVDVTYEGPLDDVRVALDDPPPGEPSPLPARRFGTSISGEGAATALSNGSVRVSLGASPFREILLGSPTSPQEICDALVTGILAVPAEEWGVGGFELGCSPLAARYRMFAIIDRTQASSPAGPRVGIAFDPAFGSAPALHLGAPLASSDPADPAEYIPRAVDPPATDDRRFSRGHAAVRVQANHVSGAGQTIVLDQGPGPALDVLSPTFTVASPQLAVAGATVLGDGSGNIDRAKITLNEGLDPSSLPLDPADFSLRQPGLPPVTGTAVTVTAAGGPGYTADRLEVVFGTGLGTTAIDDLVLDYASSAGLTGAHSATTVTTFALGDSTSPRLIDGAPPVLVSTTALDTDGNGGLDVLRFFFSEPVQFRPGRGMSYGAPHDPAVDPAALAYDAPAPLRLQTSDLAVVEHEVPVVHEGDPDLPVITGAASMAASLTESARRAEPVPAYAGFTANFENGRYILRSGVAGTGSSVTVLPAAAAGDLAPQLKLGAANGGIERPGQDGGISDLDDWVVLSSDGRTNLLFGQTTADVSVMGDTVSIDLTNVPGSGTASPTFLWRDDGDRGFISDRAPVPNVARGMNSAGLSPDFHPRELLVEAESTAGPDLTLLRTTEPGVVRLDASPSIAPTTSVDDEQLVDFSWRQVGGPFVPGGVPPNHAVVDVTPQQAGTYVFELTVTIPDATGGSFNPYLEPDRTLRRSLVLDVQPGPQDDVIILLPGQSLSPGVGSASQAVTGIPTLATEGVPYEFEVVATDAFYNEVIPPDGAMARVSTTDPDDVEPPFTPFAGSRVRLRITPTDGATTGIPEVDDEVLVAFEHGDMGRPYIVGSLWNAHATAELDPTGRVKVQFHWDADPRADHWNVYRGSLSGLADLDRDGLPDLGYGACVTPLDPDPTDELFEDAEEPPAGDGFFYIGTLVMEAFGILQETSLGLTSAGTERPNATACP